MKTEIKDLDVVALLDDIPSEGLIRGEVGTVVMDLADDHFLVEFSNRHGETYAMPTVHADQLLVLHDFLDKPEMAH